MWLGSPKLAGTWKAKVPPASEAFDEPREQRLVARHPLQGGRREQHVDRPFRIPFAEVGLTELQSTRNGLAAGVSDHLGRVVDPDHMGVRPALEQLGGSGPRAAAQVDDLPGVGMHDTSQQFSERSLPFVLVPEILLGVPARGHAADASGWQAAHQRAACHPPVRRGHAHRRPDVQDPKVGVRPPTDGGWKKRRWRADIDATTSAGAAGEGSHAVLPGEYL